VFRRLQYRYKTAEQVLAIRRAGLLTERICSAVRQRIAPGITTLELDRIAQDVINGAGASANFKLEPGYTHAICVSVNDEIVHGVPGARVLAPGDIVSVDAGAELDGWNGDSAFTVVVPGGESTMRHRRETLSAVTEQSMWAGIAALADARRVNEVGTAVERYIEDQGDYGILREYVGHGIGRSMHEEPAVFNYHVRMPGPEVRPGLVICIEPMVTDGGEETDTDPEDGWTVRTSDGSNGAHWEHEVAVTDGGVWVLTAKDGGREGLAPFGVEPSPIVGGDTPGEELTA
jgi:methionyl aminopeptidase